jgi:hypothetical protein
MWAQFPPACKIASTWVARIRMEREVFELLLQMDLCFQNVAYATKSGETVESWTSVYELEEWKVSSSQDFCYSSY